MKETNYKTQLEEYAVQPDNKTSRNTLQILLEGGIHMESISIRELADSTREAQQAMGPRGIRCGIIT